MSLDEKYMRRCLQLAQLGAGHVAPNPMVGAVLVHRGLIIGEGYHQKYGEAHAEVNCLADAKKRLAAQSEVPVQEIFAQSTLYVSLEPCAHFGKTPPCADLIIQNKIPKVVIGCRDPFKQVNGRGIEKLQAAGIEVVVGILEQDCKELNKRFFTFQIQHRPYIILKWAQTSDGQIGSLNHERLMISNEFTNRLVHQWRSEEAGILIGTNTALKDDPELTNRLWKGTTPLRLVLDNNLRLPASLKIFNDKATTIIFNKQKMTVVDDELLFQPGNKNIYYYQLPENEDLITALVNAFYQLKIQSVLVEGGAQLLQSFINSGIWDEARVITNTTLTCQNGLRGPVLQSAGFVKEINIESDRISIYYNNHSTK
jgi:diaminohydroxyphosphoribosylaminopyrimidine deaminase / 5-amino-6-(5-phosphoribosylamino)uracil reductase